MHEIYKRLLDEVSIMGINTDQSNIQQPIIKTSCLLLLCKFWVPQTAGTACEEIKFLVVR